MKIRSQLTLLILCITTIPIIFATSLPLYFYFTSPQRYLLNSYKEVRKVEGMSLTDEAWDELEKILMDVPPNVQVLVFYSQSIIISNIPELKAGTHCTPMELFDIIRSTNLEYNYQFQAPFSGRHYVQPGHESVRDTVLIVSRSPVAHRKKAGLGRLSLPAFIFILVFETACITIIITLLKSITSSITFIEKHTQRIAEGELSTALEPPKHLRMPNELSALADSLEKMRISLKDSQDRRTKFIMGISHDLRTPVALIKGYTEAISDGVVNDMDSIKKSLSIIHTKADQLEGMINDLINYVKLNNTDWRQTLVEEDIVSLIENIANGAAAAADVYKRNITSELHLVPGTKVQMDRTLFNRAVENIISNALRYTQDGDSIKITAIQDSENIKLSIADTGKGIAAKDLEHIWDLFYRGTSSRRESGFGIGLSVVKTIADTHGWNLSVESELQKGSVFTITIPLE